MTSGTRVCYPILWRYALAFNNQSNFLDDVGTVLSATGEKKVTAINDRAVMAIAILLMNYDSSTTHVEEQINEL